MNVRLYSQQSSVVLIVLVAPMWKEGEGEGERDACLGDFFFFFFSFFFIFFSFFFFFFFFFFFLLPLLISACVLAELRRATYLPNRES